jgi:hypothetical protein
MLEWTSNSKKKYVCSCFSMVNTLKIRVQILKRIKIVDPYLNG